MESRKWRKKKKRKKGKRKFSLSCLSKMESIPPLAMGWVGGDPGSIPGPVSSLEKRMASIADAYNSRYLPGSIVLKLN